MKKPPSARVNPPTQTTQRVPIRSSKLGAATGCGNGGGVGAAPLSTGDGAIPGLPAIGATGSATVGGGSAGSGGGVAGFGAKACDEGSGGGTGAGRGCKAPLSNAANRARSASISLKLLRAKISATIAISDG